MTDDIKTPIIESGELVADYSGVKEKVISFLSLEFKDAEKAGIIVTKLAKDYNLQLANHYTYNKNLKQDVLVTICINDKKAEFYRIEDVIQYINKNK